MGLKENIKNKRLEQNYTLEEVAKKVGVSKQTIQRYESGVIGNIPSDKIEKIAIALNTTPAALMGWTTHDFLLSSLDNSFKESSTITTESYDPNSKKRLLAYFDYLNTYYTKLTSENQKKVIEFTKKLLDLQNFESTTLNSKETK